jgi:hypothetical protein
VSRSSHLPFIFRTNAFSIQPDTSYFSNHPDSHSVFDAIISNLVAPSSSTLRPNPNESDEDIPLLDISPPASSFPRVIDAAALASTQVIHQSGNIILKSTLVHANDQFLVGQHARVTHGNGHIVRQLQPQRLTLFHLIVLATTVHNHAPLYSLLKRQCYWFANTIFFVIFNRYSCSTIPTGGNPCDETIDDVYIPLNHYLPDLGGRWMGVRVSNISETLIRLMTAKFESDYREELAKVCFHIKFLRPI